MTIELSQAKLKLKPSLNIQYLLKLGLFTILQITYKSPIIYTSLIITHTMHVLKFFFFLMSKFSIHLTLDFFHDGEKPQPRIGINRKLWNEIYMHAI